jgi:hypothetical protein
MNLTPPDNPAAIAMYAIGMAGYASLLSIPFFYILWRLRLNK